eukprot:UN05561
MVVKFTKKLVEAFEKSLASKNEVFSEYCNHILMLIFSKFQLFSLLLAYNLAGVSTVMCGHVFFTNTKNLVRRTFQIP